MSDKNRIIISPEFCIDVLEEVEISVDYYKQDGFVEVPFVRVQLDALMIDFSVKGAKSLLEQLKYHFKEASHETT